MDGVRTALTDWGNGIIVGHDNTNVSLIGNDVRNIGNHGIQVSYASKVGILLKENTVTKSGKDGISLSRNSSADMIGNIVYDNIGHGIVYDGSANYNGQSGVSGLIENNECYSNTSCGIWVQQGNVTIKDNIVHDNGSEGIRTEFSQNAVIVNNIVTDNGKTGDKDYAGICLEYSSATISDNTVTKSEVNFSVRGIIIGGGSAATITRNKIHNYGLSAVYAAPGSTVDVTDNQASLSGTQSFTRFAYDLKDSNDLRYAHTHLYVVEITPSSVLGQVYNNKSGNRSGAIVNGEVKEIHSSDVGVIEVSFEEQPNNENIAIFTVDKDTNNSICINVSTEYVLPEEVDQAELDREAQISCFVERFYTEILDREAEKEGLENWKLALMAGVRGGADVAYEFIKSPEYQQKMETDEKYVTRLYRAFFGRNPDKEGMESWLKDLENGEDRDFVLEGFLESKEFRELCEKYGIKRDSTRSFVRRFYKKILGRKDDQITPEELDLWQIALDSKSLTGSDMAREWINETEEFQLRPLDNEEYIKILYKVVFNRDADPDGLAHWTGKMDAGESRAEILEQIMAQPEFSDMCASYGIDP